MVYLAILISVSPRHNFLLSNLRGFLGFPANQLSGTLPTQLGRLTGLTEGFSVNYNKLSGSIPIQLSRLTRLGFLDDAAQAQRRVFKFARVASLGLGHNRFTGAFPAAIGQIERLLWVNTCFSQLSWVLPRSFPCMYEVGFCNELYATGSEDISDGSLAYYYNEDSQCNRCPAHPRLSFIMIGTRR